VGTAPPCSSTHETAAVRVAVERQAEVRRPTSRTLACRSTRLAGLSGLASWLGERAVQFEEQRHDVQAAARPGHAARCWPPMPLPASPTTFSGPDCR